MKSFTFRGLISGVFTPFNKDLSINFGIIKEYAKFLANSKVMGIVPNGTTAEGTSLSIQERKLLTEEWAKAVKETKQHLMIQIGGIPLPHVLELASHAESVGVDSLLCLPELYNKPSNAEDLVRYLKIVGEAAPKTPLIYYHSPSMTHVNISMPQFFKEVSGKVPTFSGIKFASNALDEGVEAIRASEGKFTVFLANNELINAGFAVGFDSVSISSSTVFPELVVKLMDAAKESKFEEARKLQDNLTQAIAVLNKSGSYLPALKVAMELLTPIKVGKCREPLRNLTTDQIKQLESALRSLKLN